MASQFQRHPVETHEEFVVRAARVFRCSFLDNSGYQKDSQILTRTEYSDERWLPAWAR